MQQWLTARSNRLLFVATICKLQIYYPIFFCNQISAAIFFIAATLQCLIDKSPDGV